VILLLCMLFIRRPIRWGLRFQRFKFRVMGVVAVGTEQIRSLARSSEVAGPLPVNTSLPIIVDIAMAFPTQTVTLIVTDELPVKETQFVPISGVVAVETPTHCFSMMQHDILMSLLQFPPFKIDLHGGMALTARKHPFGKWRRRDRKLLRILFGESRVTGS
jgi:hypothetical protein